MSDNPLQNTPDREARIRERAYHLWESDGRPHNRDKEFWERAEILIGMEESAGAGLLPNPQTQSGSVTAPNVEEAEIQENYGEFPDRFTDQGERRQTPKARTRPRKAKPAGAKSDRTPTNPKTQSAD
jgi:hypothetical protein